MQCVDRVSTVLSYGVREVGHVVIVLNIQGVYLMFSEKMFNDFNMYCRILLYVSSASADVQGC
jgi:hypothetical protein